MPRTLVGQPVFGNAIQFNGTDQSASRAVITSVTDNFTFAMWVYLPALPAATATVFCNGDVGANGTRMFVTTGGVFQMQHNFVVSLSSDATLSTLTWYHLALVRNGGTTQLYVNGVAAGGTTASTPNAANSFTSIGAAVNSSNTKSGFANCLMDDVRIYERALSAGELLDIVSYAADPNIVISSTSLKAWYKLDESSGNPADSSGSGLTLTNNNTATFVAGTVMVSNVPARTTAGNKLLVRDFGTCLSFDGATTDVTVTSQLFYQNTGYTVSCWVKGQPTATQARFLCLGSTASNNQVWFLQNFSASSRRLGVFIRNDANTEVGPSSLSVFSSKEVLDNKWHHITFADNNGTAVLYVDGVADATSFNYTRSGAFTFNRTGVGALVRAAVANWLSGRVDDVRIWNNTVLTAPQVADLCFRGINPSTPTSWYKFDEGSGTTATDSGSLATNGTITAATYSSDVVTKVRTVASI